MEPFRVVTIPPLSRQKLLTLYLATGGLYSVAWFSRCLRSIEEQAPSQGALTGRIAAFAGVPAGIVVLQLVMRFGVLPFGYVEGLEHLLRSPLWAAAALFGFVLFFLGARQYLCLVRDDVERHRVSLGGLIYLRHPMVGTVLFSVLWLCWMLPNPFRYVALFSVVPVQQVQVAINNYLDVVAHTAEEKHFSRLELAMACIGGAMLLWLIGGAMVRFAEMLEPTSIPGYNG